MAQDAGPLLDRLPDELLLIIIDSEQTRISSHGKWRYKVLSPRDLISLARTSRRYYTIAFSTAYERHVEEENGLAIYWAIENDQYGTLQRLVENGVDVNMRDKDNFGTPLDIGKCFHVHDLERTKAFMRPRDGARFSPLAWAARHGKDSMVEYLLDHGADIEQTSCNLCPCRDKDMLRCPETLSEPLEFCSRDPCKDDDYNGALGGDLEAHEWRPLHYALCNGKESTTRLLIERGANANEVGEWDGATALHTATRWEWDDTINYLLENGCVNINAQDLDGVTALHMAQVAGRDDLVDKYLDQGADINLAIDFYERSGPWTIFFMACATGDYGRALEYLRRGADSRFVLYHEDDEYPWTVMRLIYRSSDSVDEYPMTSAYERMELEREIIARGNRRIANTR